MLLLCIQQKEEEQEDEEDHYQLTLAIYNWQSTILCFEQQPVEIKTLLKDWFCFWLF